MAPILFCCMFLFPRRFTQRPATSPQPALRGFLRAAGRASLPPYAAHLTARTQLTPNSRLYLFPIFFPFQDSHILPTIAEWKQLRLEPGRASFWSLRFNFFICKPHQFPDIGPVFLITSVFGYPNSVVPFSVYISAYNTQKCFTQK